MKLHELSIPDARTLKNIAQNYDKQITVNLLEYLENNGFNRIGEGAYSWVYSKPKSNIIIKINYKHPDPCYIKFYNYARQNYKTNPHLPKIGKMYNYTEHGNYYFILFMEKLKPVPSKTVISIGDPYMDKADILEKVLVILMAPEHRYKPHHYDILDEFSQSHPKLYQTILTLKQKFANSFECKWDLHIDNIMTRPSTGDLVIIDPWA